MSPRPRFLDLDTGLRIAFEEYGNPAGEPVFFCHGWPSSRTMAAVTHDAACELGVRIISPDRPGIALSDFQPGRTFLDWPPVFSQLAKMLGIGHYRILGVSGGAPYTFAAAWANSTEVKAVAIVSGAPPLDGKDNALELLPAYTWLLRAYHANPELIRLLFRSFRPFALLPPMALLKPFLLSMQLPEDRAALEQGRSFEICFESSREAWRKSSAGVTLDAELYAGPWGFPLDEIKAPVRLWHGKKDRSFSWTLAEALSKSIPFCKTYFVENEGHYSLPILHVRRILEDLINAG